MKFCGRKGAAKAGILDSLSLFLKKSPLSAVQTKLKACVPGFFHSLTLNSTKESLLRIPMKEWIVTFLRSKILVLHLTFPPYLFPYVPLFLFFKKRKRRYQQKQKHDDLPFPSFIRSASLHHAASLHWVLVKAYQVTAFIIYVCVHVCTISTVDY